MFCLTVFAEQARVRGRALHLFDPDQPLLTDEGAAARYRDHVAVDLRDRVVDVVHVGLFDPDQHLLALSERKRAGLDLLAGAFGRDREGVERAPFAAMEVEGLPGPFLELSERLAAAADQDRRHARMDLDEERLGLRALYELAQPPLDVDRDRLLRAHDSLAITRRAGLVHDLAHAL